MNVAEHKTFTIYGIRGRTWKGHCIFQQTSAIGLWQPPDLDESQLDARVLDYLAQYSNAWPRAGVRIQCIREPGLPWRLAQSSPIPDAMEWTQDINASKKRQRRNSSASSTGQRSPANHRPVKQMKRK